MNIPEQYLKGLTPPQRVLQARLIAKSRQQYKESGLVQERPAVSSKGSVRSTHAKKFQEKYGFVVSDLKKVKDLFVDTNVDEILARGAAAYASSGSRPNVSSFAWRFARLASVFVRGAAYDKDKDLVGEKSKKIIFS